METVIPDTLKPVLDETFQKIHDIESLLLKSDPTLPGHLAAIHRNLTRYEELNHLLSDDQIRQLIRGQAQVTGTVIMQTVMKSTKAANTKMAKGITAADL